MMAIAASKDRIRQVWRQGVSFAFLPICSVRPNDMSGDPNQSSSRNYRLRYSDYADYIVASIVYLGTNTYYWGRTPRDLAMELGLDEVKLKTAFEGFPGLFRKTQLTSEENGQNFYALQARHAQRRGGNTKDPERIEDIKPLDKDTLDLLFRFVLQMTEQEKADRRGWWTGGIAVGAAVLSAITAITVGIISLAGH